MQARAQLAQSADGGDSDGSRLVTYANYHDVVSSSGRADTCKQFESGQSGTDSMTGTVHRLDLKGTADSAYTAGLTSTTGSLPLVRHDSTQLSQDAALNNQGADTCQSPCDNCTTPLLSKANSGSRCTQPEAAANVNLPHSQQQLPGAELQHQESLAPSTVPHITGKAALSEAGSLCSPAKAPQAKLPDEVHQQSQLPASRQPSSIFSDPGPEDKPCEVATSNVGSAELRVEGCPVATQQQVLRRYHGHVDVHAKLAQTMLQPQDPEPAQNMSRVS